MSPFIKVKSAANTDVKVKDVIQNFKSWAESGGGVDLAEVGAAASKFPTNFFQVEQKYVKLQTVIDTINKEMGLISMDMGEAPDLVTRALLLDSHMLNTQIVEKAFPAGVQVELYNLKAKDWAATLLKCQDNGLKKFREKAFGLTGYYITNDVSFTLIATRTKTDIFKWFFNKCTRAGIVYLLQYFRDIINFPFLVQATNGNTGNNILNGANDIWQAKYTDDEQKLAARVLHMLQLKCAEMLTAVWLYMIDNDDNVKEFPISRSLCVAAVDAYKASRVAWNEREVWYTPVGLWPVHSSPRFRKMKDTSLGVGGVSYESSLNEDLFSGI